MIRRLHGWHGVV